MSLGADLSFCPHGLQERPGSPHSAGTQWTGAGTGWGFGRLLNSVGHGKGWSPHRLSGYPLLSLALNSPPCKMGIRARISPGGSEG